MFMQHALQNILHNTWKYENVLELDAVRLCSSNDLRITMKVTFSSSRLYLSSLDNPSARRRVLDQP
jgi:hypothetical protein